MRTNKLTAVALSACTLLALAPTGEAWAFKPEYESHGHTMIARSVLGGPQYSFGETEGQPLTVPRFKFRYSTSAQDQWARSWAIDQIVTGVQSRDWGVGDLGAITCSNIAFGQIVTGRMTATDFVQAPSDGHPNQVGLCLSDDINDPHGHFDNDNFVGSLRSIVEHLDFAVSYAQVAANPNNTPDLRQQHRVASRVMLGKAIHTVQDFYAHSNWVERFSRVEVARFITDYVLMAAIRTVPLSALSISSLSAQGYPAAPALARQELRKDRVAFGAGEGGGIAVGDYCVNNTGVESDTWRRNDGNWNTSTADTAAVTTAAWWDSLGGANSDFAAASDTEGRRRCDHGVSDDAFNKSGYATFKQFSGIAKDLPGWPPNPSPQGRVTGAGVNLNESYDSPQLWPWLASATTAKSRAEADGTVEHMLASYLAARHTKLFLETFVSYTVARHGAAAADSVLEVIFGSPAAPAAATTWVLDRSGTMADVIPAVRANVKLSMPPGARIVLVDFAGLDNASGLSAITTIGSPTEIAARLDAIEARDGGGCATPLWSAIEMAINASLPNSIVVAFADASASDGHKADVVKAAAQKKGIRINTIISGSCSPLDPSYAIGTQATGGSVKLVTHDDDGIAAAVAALETNAESGRTVHTEAAVLTASKAISFPVETGTSKLTVVVNGSLTAAGVTRPDGTALASGTGVTVSPILNGYVYVVTNPEQGTWTVLIAGSGAYAVSAYINAAIAFDLVEYKSVLKVGRPGHEYRPQLAQTGQSGRVWMKAQITGAQAPITLDLLRLDGSVVSTFPLSKMAENYFEGEITLPTEAHRLRVRGLAADNTAFARIYGQGNVAPPAAAPGRIVTSQSTSPTWRAGTVNAFAMNLKNLGGTDTAALGAGTLPTGASLNCSPNSVALLGSEQINVLCSLHLPEAPDRADFSVAVTTASGTQQVIVPLIPLKLPLSCALDIDGDNHVDPVIDGVLLTRYLLGFRGNALTDGLTISGPRKTANLLNAFFGSAAQFDVVGRATPAPTAMVDGLLMTRLMLGFDDTALLSGISLPADAQYRTASAIKDYVISRCAGGF